MSDAFEARETRRMSADLTLATPHRTGAFRIGRRSFLRGASGVVLPLPFLESLARPAEAAEPPRFYLLWHQGQGTQYYEWARKGSTESTFEMGKILEPVAAHRERMLFIIGVDNALKKHSSGDGHTTAQVSCLTCRANGGGPSFDQVLSQRIRGGGQRSSLNLAVGYTAGGRLFSGPGQKIESEADPRVVLKAAFTSTPSSSDALETIYFKQKSVLDAVSANLQHLRARLGREDRARLDQHADKLRELETRYMQKKSSSCAPPKLPLVAGYSPTRDHQVSAQAQIEIAAMAFACNLTPVASIIFTDDHNPPPFVEFSKGYPDWHDMVHKGEFTEGKRNFPGLISGYRWYAAQFAKLLDRFSEVQVGGRSLLDQTLIQWTADFGYGAGHNEISVQVALAGNLGANAKMGRLIQYTKDVEDVFEPSKWTLNNLYVTILRAFGQNDDMFGQIGRTNTETGPLAGVFG